MMMATDFASGGATHIPCAKEAPDYRAGRYRCKAPLIMYAVEFADPRTI
jgi:hypothetical protein